MLVLNIDVCVTLLVYATENVGSADKLVYESRQTVSKIRGDGYLYITFFIINRFIFHQIFCRILANTLQHSPIVLCECVCVYCIQYSLLEYTESWLVLQRDSFLEMLLSGFSSICSSVSEIFYCFWTLLVAIKYHLY